MFGVRKLFIFLHIFPTLHAIINEEIKEVYQIPAYVKQLCPYTSFCEGNASMQFPGNNEEMPCCQDCSCDPTCGLHNNCCYKHLDVYNIEETYRMICRSLYITTNIPKHLLDTFEITFQPHFRMINKCLGSSQAMQQVRQKTEVFNPVYSVKNSFIYINEDIAKCNDVTNVIPSRKAFLCSFEDQFTADQDRIIQGEEGNAECVTTFIFPEEVNLKSEYCEPEIIQKCNVTGEVTKWQPYWKYCGSFNATYTLNKINGSFVYSNIFCFMCNQYYEGNPFRQQKYKCSEPHWLPKNSGKDYSMTMILIPDLYIDGEIENDVSERQIGCPKNHAIIHSFTITCRPIKCPFWKVLVSGKCKFYSKRWIGGPFVIMLRLLPLEGKRVLRSFIDELYESDKYDLEAKWLKRKTLKHWDIVSFYHPSPNDSYIEYFVVLAKWPFRSLNPEKCENQILATLGDTWYVKQTTEYLALKVELNEFQLYKSLLESSTGEILSTDAIRILYKQENFSPNMVYIPDVFYQRLRNYEKVIEITRQMTDEILYKMTGNYWNLFDSELFITKVLLCRQVDLLPDEYEDNGDTIFFKVKNITLRDFRTIKNTMHTDSDNSSAIIETVRICLQEFQHTMPFAGTKRSFKFNDFILLTIVSVGIRAMSLI